MSATPAPARAEFLAAEAEAAAARWCLAGLSGARANFGGERLGAAPGAGLEFHDRREYRPGDDLRRIDWGVLARSDQWLVRRQREEIAPRLELYVDRSASMAVEPAKAEAVVALAALIAILGRAEGRPVSVRALDGRASELEVSEVRAGRLPVPGPVHLVEAVRGAARFARRGAERVVLSDFFGADPVELVSPLAAGAGWMACVQVLGPEEAAPKVGGVFELEDAETGQRIEISADGPSVAAYLERLERQRSGLAAAAARSGALLATLVAGPSLAELCRGPLAAAGVLVAR